MPDAMNSPSAMGSRKRGCCWMPVEQEAAELTEGKRQRHQPDVLERGGISGSADWQSAVTPIGNRRHGRLTICAAVAGPGPASACVAGSADRRPAVARIGNPRCRCNPGYVGL